jgi:hypothetical protein
MINLPLDHPIPSRFPLTLCHIIKYERRWH